jgi:hypothetical protein
MFSKYIVMPQGSPFASSSRHQMGSNYLTDINQGGGNKKAGFPYIVGRDTWVSIYFSNNNASRPLSAWNKNVFPLARQSRPVGSSYQGNYRYNKIPGTA